MVAILLPTAGERLDVVLKCLLGASSQRSWPSSSPSKTGRGDGLRVIVLDEKRRKVRPTRCSRQREMNNVVK